MEDKIPEVIPANCRACAYFKNFFGWGHCDFYDKGTRPNDKCIAEKRQLGQRSSATTADDPPEESAEGLPEKGNSGHTVATEESDETSNGMKLAQGFLVAGFGVLGVFFIALDLILLIAVEKFGSLTLIGGISLLLCAAVTKTLGGKELIQAMGHFNAGLYLDDLGFAGSHWRDFFSVALRVLFFLWGLLLLVIGVCLSILLPGLVKSTFHPGYYFFHWLMLTLGDLLLIAITLFFGLGSVLMALGESSRPNVSRARAKERDASTAYRYGSASSNDEWKKVEQEVREKNRENVQGDGNEGIDQKEEE